VRPASADLHAALAAIRRAGRELSGPLDAWATGPPARRQVFVSEGAGDARRGQEYDTWVVTLAADGSAVQVECFRSAACGARGRSGNG